MTASINLGCYFSIGEDGSLKRIEKDFFKSDENVTQGKLIHLLKVFLRFISEFFMKTPENSDVNESFLNEAIHDVLMQDGKSVIFEFEFKAFEVNSVSEENEYFFPCWYFFYYFNFSQK